MKKIIITSAALSLSLFAAAQQKQHPKIDSADFARYIKYEWKQGEKMYHLSFDFYSLREKGREGYEAIASGKRNIEISPAKEIADKSELKK